MTPESSDDELRDSPLSPADDERIRRLLAEARHTEPIPAEVASRLEDVLADLSADRARRDAAQQTSARGKVVDLAARRRRTAANLLVAAAAVIAVGVGISQVLPQAGSDDAGGEALSPADTAAEDGAGAGSGGSGMEGESGAPAAPTQDTPKVRSQRFGADVRKVQSERMAYALSAPMFYADLNRGCLTTDAGEGEYVPVTYDGASGVVVLRVPSGDVQVVDLYLCGDTTPRRSITLTLP